MIKVSNFNMLYEPDDRDFEGYYHAEVDIEYGYLWWKRKNHKVKISKRNHTTYWSFDDTGKFTPDRQVEYLEDISKIKKHRESKNV